MNVPRIISSLEYLDDDLLEEARATERKNSNVLYFRAAVAACLVLVLLIPTTHFYKNTASLRMLSDMGYVLALPASVYQPDIDPVSVGIHAKLAAVDEFLLFSASAATVITERTLPLI